MKKQMICSFLAISLAGMMCAGCGQSTEKKDLKLSSLDEKKGDDKNVELTVWGAKEDQELLKEIVDSFQEKYKGEAKFNITISAQSEADCKDAALGDVSECADVFTFADDQLTALAAAGVLKPVENAEKIKEDSLDGAVQAASINDTLYAYPLTADNGYFMYYNKSYFSDSDLQSLDKMLEKAAAKGKKVTMDWNSGWYLYSFFANTGLKVGLNDDGITNYCTWNSKKGDVKGVDVAESMMKIARSKGFKEGNDDVLANGAKDGSVIAGVSGVWLAERLKEAWGSNYAATKLPTYTVAGKQVQLGSYVGYKMVGVNSNSKQVSWATKLAEWITSEENQELRFEKRGQGPANAKASETDAVKQNVAIKALLEQSDYGSLQRVGGKYWEPVAEFGAKMATGSTGELSVQKTMDELVKNITANE